VPDVIEMLNHDHREVEVLFTEFESSQSYDVAMEICEELLLHATVEEEIVYPALRQADAEIEREAEQEHKEAEQLIEQIQALQPGDPQLTPLVMRLKQSVQHHVEEEETQAWPKMRQQFADKLESLGQAVEQRKEQLKTEEGGEIPLEGGRTSPSSATGGLLDLTKEELYEKAKQADIKGRSNMKKEELAEALTKRS
jgi:hemerythrin superfamily protein